MIIILGSKRNNPTMHLTLIGIFSLFIGCSKGAVASSSSDVRVKFESQTKPAPKDRPNPNEITDALFEIAKILKNNQEHSNLYEKVAALEASLALSLERNGALELRIKALEGKIPDIDSKLEVSNQVLEKTASLEMSTRKLMENFEEKLSTLAAEILRLKNVASRENDEASHTSNHFQSNQVFDLEQTREVVLRDICTTWHSSSCLFTVEGKLSNWTVARKECEEYGGHLATPSDTVALKLPKEAVKRFWVDDSPKRNSAASEEKQEDLGESPRAALPISDLHYRGRNENTNIDFLKFNPLFRAENSTAKVIDIHNLPDSAEADENMEKTVYRSNVVSNSVDRLDGVDSLVQDSNFGGASERRHLSRRSVEDSISLSPPDDAVPFKDFLGLEPEGSKLSSHDDSVLDNGARRGAMSDESASLVAESSSFTFTERRDSTSSSRSELCPLLVCEEDAECQTSWSHCSTLNSILCRKKG